MDAAPWRRTTTLSPKKTRQRFGKLCLAQLSRRKLDADAILPTALGASIEVQALSAVMQGRRDEAVVFLRSEEQRWHDTSIRARIQKNLNLLTLEGKPAPALEAARPLCTYQGHPVLLFFWAHWCSDCKQEIAIVQQLEKNFVQTRPDSCRAHSALRIRRRGKDASRAVETRYIHDVYAKYYAGLGHIETPLSEENFARYGVSTTPTLVLIDAQGIVRLYNPGAMAYGPLAARLESLLRP